MLDDLTLFQMAQKRMDWAARRQQVLAENVANADTPGFKPRDIAQPDFKRMLAQTTAVRATATNPLHVSSPPMVEDMDMRAVKTPYEASPDGNAVVLEEQMQKVGETRAAHDLAATLFQKHVRLLKTALGRGGGY